MSARIGIELGARAVRGVRLAGWRGGATQAVEIECDRGNPGAAVEALREQLGPGGRIAVAVDLPLLFIKRVPLPPLDAAEKQRILRLEPERFFAVRGEDVVAAARSDDTLVFAAREAPLQAWVTALESLGPVEAIEPGPAALVRALASAGVTDAAGLWDAHPDGVGLVVVRGGRAALVRRVYGDLSAAAHALQTVAPLPGRVFVSPWSEERARIVASSLPGTTPEPLPAIAGVAAPFLTALGAALAIDGALDQGGSLAPTELTARITTRRRRGLAIAGVACLAALVFAVGSLDAWRGRGLDAVQRGLPALRDRAAPALALQTEIQAAAREVEAIRRAALDRPDPLRVLAALSTRLPADAYFRTLRSAGRDWQVDGYAPNAAQLLTQLAATPQLADVHFLSATTRVTIGNRTYDSFALAFRFVAAP